MFSSSEYINAYTGPAEYHRYGVTVEGNEQLVVDRALSKSFVTSLPPNEQEDMTKKIRAIVQKGDGKVWIDEKTGTFEYPYATGESSFLFRREGREDGEGGVARAC